MSDYIPPERPKVEFIRDSDGLLTAAAVILALLALAVLLSG